MWFHIHYLSGYFSGRLLKLERSEKIMLILSAILPDFDSVFYFIISGFHDPATFHAGITHTFLTGFLMSTILAIVSFGIMKWRNPKTDNMKLGRFIILGLLGIFLHLLLDINTIANEYGEIHHIYFWPINNSSYHLDILLADIFPRYPYFNFEKFMFLKYSAISIRIVATLSLIINGVMLLILIYEWVPIRKIFPWDPFMYNSDRMRDPWIGDNTEVILNILLSLAFFGAFFVRIDYLFRQILGTL
ncbi:MAG: metal-dependent hydrolase [Candidatus Hodarchaeota archaeon]